MSAGRFTVESVFKGVDRVTAPVRRMASRVNKAFRRMDNGIKRINKRMRTLAKSAGSTLGVAGMAGLMFGLQAAIRGVITTGAEFEQQLVGAGARFGFIRKGTKAYAELEKAARKFGAITEFTATQAAGALNFMAKAGFSAKTAMGLLPQVINLATAAEIDLARASDIATDSLGAFGLLGGDAATTVKRFTVLSDMMATAVNRSNQTLETLFEAIRKAGPAATAAGVPVETFIALTEQMASSGLKGDLAATQLKNVFLQLAKGDVQEKLRQLGVEVRTTSGDMKPFAQIVRELNKGLEGTGKLDIAGFLDELFGKRGITAMSIALKSGADDLERLEKGLLASGGAMKLLAEIMRDTRQGQLDKLSSAFESLTLSVSTANDKGIGDMLKSLTDLTRQMDRFVQVNPDAAVMGAWIIGLSLAAIVVGGLGAAIGFVVTSTGGLIAIVGVAAVAFGGWLAKLEPVSEWFDKFFALDFNGKLKEVIKLVNFITNPFGALAGVPGLNFDTGIDAAFPSTGSSAADLEDQERKLADLRGETARNRRINDARKTRGTLEVLFNDPRMSATGVLGDLDLDFEFGDTGGL